VETAIPILKGPPQILQSTVPIRGNYQLGSTGVDDRIVPDNAVPGFRVRPNIEQIEK
jgi:hypothetical protein